ncbi:hypothetical protein QY96_01133 [Bacillus thermotolerans]|nr:hypothetical protein QY96_01133 [Bacillus thermotolerans]
MSPKEQVPRKDPLGANLSGKRTTAGRISGERLHSRPPKGKGLIPVIELNFQAEGQRKGVVITLSFSVFFVCRFTCWKGGDCGSMRWTMVVSLKCM